MYGIVFLGGGRMERSTMAELAAWKERKDRKPLVLRGARQVGKTWLMREFGRRCYENVVYCNFDEADDLKGMFAQTKNPARLVELLSLLSGEPICAGRTLLLFDEVQECPDALNALKYFREQMPEQHVIAAGSLLGTYLATPHSYPVGQVDLLSIYPMTFAEFLTATNETLAALFASLRPGVAIPDAFHERLMEAYRTYLIIGGMPECVAAWADEHDPRRVRELQRAILALYENDFTKHNGRVNAARILMVYRSIIPQLSRENEKFTYRLVKQGARAREFEEAVEWLVSAGILHRIYNVAQPGYPLKAYEMQSHFKLFFLDTGLLNAMGEVENEAILFDKAFPFKGAMTENFVLQQFLGELPAAPHYYAPDAQHEIDFLLQWHGEVVPVEVKAGTMRQAASFRRYLEKYQPRAAFRYSARNYKQDGAFTNLPLYLAGRTEFLSPEMDVHHIF